MQRPNYPSDVQRFCRDSFANDAELPHPILFAKTFAFEGIDIVRRDISANVASWRGLKTNGAPRVMLRVNAIRSAACGLALSVLLVAACSDRATADDNNNPTGAPNGAKPVTVSSAMLAVPTHTSGQPPGKAFIDRFDKGFDETTSYLGDYVMDNEWNATGFDPRNIQFGKKGMTLVIEKRKLGTLPWAGAEFQRSGFFGYGRYEVIVQPPGGSGLVTSFFTHTGQYFGDPHDEIDFEFLGKNTHEVHIKHFRNGESPGSTYVQLPFDYSAAPHLYAFEWEPDSIRWYIDGQLVHEASGPAAGIPTTSSRVMMNIWTGRGDTVSWHGPQRFGRSARATYHCLSHVPKGETGPQCSDGYKPPGKR